MKRGILLLILLLMTLYAFAPTPSSAVAQGVAWPTIRLTPLPHQFEAPVFLTHAGDGSGRLFVVEQSGYIRVIDNGQVLGEPFLDIHEEVVFDGEQGLLSMAFSPNYSSNGEFYVNYTEESTGGDTYIVRYRVSAQNPNIADPTSAEIVLIIEQPYSNHNGGQLQFGPDGMLYIGVGDGGSGGDPQNYAQTPGTLLGKMLRIDVETGDPATYTIPADNPYVGNTAYRGEIWSVGVRNPWRFSFDRETGDMYMADVGQGQWEEVNFQPAGIGGQNWGWRCYEGTHEYNLDQCDEEFPYDMPIHEYNHDNGCSVTGGYVYRGDSSEEMNGIYFYTDYCSGTVWGLQNPGTGWVNQVLAEAGFGQSSFGEDENGTLYLLNALTGAVQRIDDVRYTLYLPLTQTE
jgi:glucose/arabinose dehydrogenase